MVVYNNIKEYILIQIQIYIYLNRCNLIILIKRNIEDSIAFYTDLIKPVIYRKSFVLQLANFISLVSFYSYPGIHSFSNSGKERTGPFYISNNQRFTKIFQTSTKKDTITEWGIQGIKKIRSQTDKPIDCNRKVHYRI